MSKKQILFVCIHNSARSQMAEAWFNHFCGNIAHAESAGLEPGTLNPRVVTVMQEVGIDISNNTTDAVLDYINAEKTFTYVITVCDETSAERCPVFPGNTQRLHWSFPDPSALVGSEEEKLAETRKIRDTIKQKVEAWCKTICD